MSREGATVERHLALLGVRDAYLLLVLVPLGQRHVLTTIPTGKGKSNLGVSSCMWWRRQRPWLCTRRQTWGL